MSIINDILAWIDGTDLETKEKVSLLRIHKDTVHLDIMPVVNTLIVNQSISHDEVKSINVNRNNTEIIYNLAGAQQAAVLITITSPTDWRIRLGGRELLTEDGDTWLTEDGDTIIEE